MLVRIAEFGSDESGATAIEYALIAVLVALVMVAGLTAMGQAINTKYDSVQAAVAATP